MNCNTYAAVRDLVARYSLLANPGLLPAGPTLGNSLLATSRLLPAGPILDYSLLANSGLLPAGPPCVTPCWLTLGYSLLAQLWVTYSLPAQLWIVSSNSSFYYIIIYILHPFFAILSWHFLDYLWSKPCVYIKGKLIWRLYVPGYLWTLLWVQGSTPVPTVYCGACLSTVLWSYLQRYTRNLLQY